MPKLILTSASYNPQPHIVDIQVGEFKLRHIVYHDSFKMYLTSTMGIQIYASLDILLCSKERHAKIFYYF